MFSESLGDQVTEQLRRAIVSGSFQPNERLIEEDVAEQLDATRATVRLAIARLEQDGLIERRHNRGVRVRLVSEQEALEILEARKALESLVARHAALNAVPADVTALKTMLSAMERCCRLNDIAAYVDLDARLHEKIDEMARHSTAMRLLSLLKSQLVRYQYRILYAPGRLSESVAQHRKVVDAIAKRNPEAAERAMRDHLDGALDVLRALAADNRKRSLQESKPIRRKHS